MTTVYVRLKGGGLEQWSLSDRACPRCGRALFLRGYGGAFWSPDEEFQCGSCDYPDAGPPERRSALRSRVG